MVCFFLRTLIQLLVILYVLITVIGLFGYDLDDHINRVDWVLFH